MPRPKFFSAELELQQAPNEVGLQHILDYFPEEEKHYFYGGVIQITQGKVAHLVNFDELPESVQLRPTLTYAPEDALERRLFREGKRIRDLSYISTPESKELLFALANKLHTSERSEVLANFYKVTTQSKIKQLLEKAAHFIHTIF